jgi:hypothetical protein
MTPAREQLCRQSQSSFVQPKGRPMETLKEMIVINGPSATPARRAALRVGQPLEQFEEMWRNEMTRRMLLTLKPRPHFAPKLRNSSLAAKARLRP